MVHEGGRRGPPYFIDLHARHSHSDGGSFSGLSGFPRRSFSEGGSSRGFDLPFSGLIWQRMAIRKKFLTKIDLMNNYLLNRIIKE